MGLMGQLTDGTSGTAEGPASTLMENVAAKTLSQLLASANPPVSWIRVCVECLPFVRESLSICCLQPNILKQNQTVKGLKNVFVFSL